MIYYFFYLYNSEKKLLHLVLVLKREIMRSLFLANFINFDSTPCSIILNAFREKTCKLTNKQ